MPEVIEELRDDPYQLLEDLRNMGWFVGVHNDYKLNGVRYTFWMLTRPSDNTFIKGEGTTDYEALQQCLVEHRKLGGFW